MTQLPRSEHARCGPSEITRHASNRDFTKVSKFSLLYGRILLLLAGLRFNLAHTLNSLNAPASVNV